jgi:glutamate formiminotransferase/formiminotetrahydrofolate cyclodeaminase
MRKLVECVPNFSEGRDRAKLDAISAAIEAVRGVSLLDVDAGADTNRSVFTLVGEPEAVLEAAFQAIRTAADVIDMRRHKGAHARMGATDVCPFVPLAGTSMEECVELVRRLGRRVGDELGIPVYLYEHAATRPERRNLAEIRAGEYEALPQKMQDPAFAPDFGPAVFNPQSGATVIGARDFLVAYNINLNTKNTKLPKQIANEIREKGAPVRDAAGKLVKDAQGETVYRPGRFKHCKATGWYLSEHGLCQVTMNLTNFAVTPVHEVFDAVCDLAREAGLRVTGSEIVGLVPREALLAAGRHYLQRQGENPGVPEAELVAAAVRSLGLNELSPFDPAQKVIEYRVARTNLLVARSVADFLDELSSSSPAPGGGSVSALCASLAASLAGMVAALTFGKKGYEAARPEMVEVSGRAQRLKDRFRELVDEDTDAFHAVMDAFRLPKASDAEKAAREAAILEANKNATLTPLSLARLVAEELPSLIDAVVQRGNPNSLSDAGVAALAARAALEGACLNVFINLAGISDAAFVAQVRAQAQAWLDSGAPALEALSGAVRSRLVGALPQ